VTYNLHLLFIVSHSLCHCLLRVICTGQNKNNHVLRLAPLLVEAGYFLSVNFIFYIVGHTKNICDRWFNTLKKNYRRQNIYTFDQLCQSWENANERITLHRVDKEFFKKFYEFENLFYKRITTGHCEPNHIFSVKSNNPTKMIIKRNNIETHPIFTQDMKSGNFSNEERVHLLRTRPVTHLGIIPIPGIADIKQYELFKKWRKVVPMEFWKDTCPTPSSEVIERIQKRKKEKSAEYRLKKKGNTTVNKRPNDKNRICKRALEQPQQKPIPKKKKSVLTTKKQFNERAEVFVGKFPPNNSPSKHKVRPIPPVARKHLTQQPNVGPISNL